MKRLLAIIVALLASPCFGAWPHDSVCEVRCPPYGGSGCMVAVSENGHGLVISAAHVFEEGNRNALTCKFPTVEKPIRARILGSDQLHDLIALDIDAPANVGTPAAIKAASEDDGKITHVGYPWNAQGKQRYLVGEFAGYRQGDPSDLLTKCHVISGYSGGARFNQYGEYLGVISGYMGEREIRTWGASGQALKKFVAKWFKNEPTQVQPAPTPLAPAKRERSILVELDPEFREVNHDGSCGYIATAYCLKMCGLWREAREFRRRNRGPSSDDSIHAALNELGVRHKIGRNGDEKLLRWAVKEGRGAAVTWGGAHCITLCGMEGDNVVLLGNHEIALKEYKRESWSEFLENHRNSGGWSVVILDGHPAKPEAR